MNPEREQGAATGRLCILLFMAVFAWFLPALPFEITNWDDDFYIEMNPYLRAGFPGNSLHAFGEFYFGNYHPLTMVSYAFDYALGGMSPAVFRAQNVAWHAAAAVLLALLLRRFGAGEAAFLLALGWAIHPLRNENVVWLSERKDVISMCFILAALLMRTLPPGGAGGPRTKRALAVEFAALLLALLAKPIAVVYAPIALAHDVLLDRGRLRSGAPFHCLLWFACIAFAWLNLQAQHGDPLPPEYTTIPARAKGLLLSLGWYPLKVLLPSGLSPLHPRAFAPGVASLPFVSCMLVAGSLLAWGWLGRRASPAITFGIASYLLALFPVSGVIPDGAHFVADRYAYLPTVGLLIALAASMAHVTDRARILAASALLLPVAFASPLAQMEAWRTSRSLWERVLTVYPEFETARVKIAQEDMERGRTPPTAIAAAAGGSPLAAEVSQRALLRAGRLDEARAAAASLPAGAMRHRAELLLSVRAGDRDAALRSAESLLSSPDRSREDAGLAVCKLVEVGDVDAASRIASRHDHPISITMAHGHGMVARALTRMGRNGEALAHLRMARAVNPEDDEAIRAVAEHARATGDHAFADEWLSSVASRPGLPSATRDALSGAAAASRPPASAPPP